CKCGTRSRPCKNREQHAERIVEGNINANPSAFERHQQAVETAQREIEAFIAPLSSDEKDNLLVRLLSQGRGSLDFARNLLEDVREPDPDPDPDPPQNNPTGTGGIAWCKCSVCEVMPTTEENVCCKLVTCVTSYQRFHNICIDREVLELAIRVRCDIRADEPDYSMTSYRIAAYRQYVLWKYG
ncbi:uncharacterized protein LOC114575110, partial [Exaiptasia diaphana]|uniref:P2X purinoreceptor 7 intracellular domain-containing protein n=1 Tax=Exaiptasia diaphana TaxID=2652724 RepID=A0A913YJ17_EXADI